MQEIGYLSGEGTVIVAGDTVLLLAAPAGSEVATTLWRLVVAGMSHDQVRAVLETYSPANLPDLGVASLRPDGLALLLRGAVRAEVTALGATTGYSDENSQLWTERTVGTATSCRLWLREPAEGGTPLPLVGGVARAGAVLVGLAGTATPARPAPAHYVPASPPVPPQQPWPGYAPATPVAPAAPPMEGVFLEHAEDHAGQAAAASTPAAIGSISQVWVRPPSAPAVPTPPAAAPPALPHLTDPAPAGGAAVVSPGGGGPRPAVWAARCPQSHLNAPDAAACRVCGSAITDRELSIVQRPPLGRLDFGEFGSVPLDGDLVIGRQDGEAPAEGQRWVTVAHPSLSRRHAEIQVRDWLVAVVDLGSANGTRVALPGRAPEALRDHDPVPIQPGTVVWLGDVPFTYVVQP